MERMATKDDDAARERKERVWRLREREGNEKNPLPFLPIELPESLLGATNGLDGREQISHHLRHLGKYNYLV